MPSPAAEAHLKAMEDKYAPAEAAMLANATPAVLYTHHVMGVYKQYDQLGRVNAVSHNHHNAHAILSKLVDHALFAMRACVQCEEAASGERVAIEDHQGLALLFDNVSAEVANGDYEKATNALEIFLANALSVVSLKAAELHHATHGAVAGDLQFLAAILQDHYIHRDKYVNKYAPGSLGHVQLLIRNGKYAEASDALHAHMAASLESMHATATGLLNVSANASGHVTEALSAQALELVRNYNQDRHNGWVPIAEAPTEEGSVADLWVVSPSGVGERVTDCFVAGGKWVTWDIHHSGHDTPGSNGGNITHFRLAPQPPRTPPTAEVSQ